jgi:hypothetical protein
MATPAPVVAAAVALLNEAAEEQERHLERQGAHGR